MAEEVLTPSATTSKSDDGPGLPIEITTIFIVALLLGCLGWFLPSVGGSLLKPTLIVMGVGVILFTIGASASAKLGHTSQGFKILLPGIAAVTILAGIWTFQFSLAARIWTSNATTQVQSIFTQLEHSPNNHNGLVLDTPCAEHDVGNVGPLSAPYRECATWTPQGHFVTFTTKHSIGLGYTDSGAATFPDQCVHHLEGSWWMFAESDDAGDPGQCPFGYRFQGGG